MSCFSCDVAMPVCGDMVLSYLTGVVEGDLSDVVVVVVAKGEERQSSSMHEAVHASTTACGALDWTECPLLQREEGQSVRDHVSIATRQVTCSERGDSWLG